MFLNNLKIAFRQLKKQKFYSFINIIGLSIGVACCILISLYIKDELSYDKHHSNLENLYRVGLDINLNDWQGRSTAVPPILTKALIEQIPEIKNAARFNPHFDLADSNMVRKEDEKENNYEEGFVYADQEIFELFSLPLIAGEKSSILVKPNTMVLTERMAEKYFPNENPIGQVLVFNDDKEDSYTITGVVENIPEQSHFQYDYFLSMSSLGDSKSTGWVSNNYYAYVALAPGVTNKDIVSKLDDFSLKNFGPPMKKELNTDLVAIAEKGQFYKLFLQPVEDIYLKSEGYLAHEIKSGNIGYIRLIGIIALFIFLIAIVNFVNLSTARSANRAKEVGLRKVLGSFHKQLVAQFLTESVLMSFLAFIIGIMLAIAFLPLFNQVAAKSLSIPLFSVGFTLPILCISIIVGILAGLYPSFYLSAFQPVKVLKGKLSLGSKNSWLRSSLVVFQFAISIGLIAGTFLVYQQISYIQNKNLGFEKDQVLLIQDTYTISDQLPEFKTSLKKLPEAKNVTVSSYLPLDGGRRNSMSFRQEGKTKVDDQILLQCWNIDEDYINTLGMTLKDGRNFDPKMALEANSVILNERAAQDMGLGKSPVGKKIGTPFNETVYTVIGLIEDFHFEGLKNEVRSVGLFLGLSNSVVSLKTTAGEMENLIAKAEGVWKNFAPNQPFRYEFLDERFSTMYKTEERIGKLFLIFSALAILIACLGLLALATFMTEQRMKEIGIRKVLGASVPNIVFTLSKKFLFYVLIGLVIAVPISWIQMNNWLEHFVYRINVEWWVFLCAGLLAIGIAFFTVGLQSLRAALTNPVTSIRGE